MPAKPPPDYSFRPAERADVAAVTALVDAAYGHYVERLDRPPGPMQEDYAKIIRSHQVTVAETGNAIVGVLVLATNDEGFFVKNVAVDPAHRGKGLGKEFLMLAETEARRAGFDSIYLFTHEKMTENLSLYSKIGYCEYVRRPQGGFSLVFMRKNLVEIRAIQLKGK